MGRNQGAESWAEQGGDPWGSTIGGTKWKLGRTMQVKLTKSNGAGQAGTSKRDFIKYVCKVWYLL